jgi:hypothetical protein
MSGLFRCHHSLLTTQCSSTARTVNSRPRQTNLIGRPSCDLTSIGSLYILLTRCLLFPQCADGRRVTCRFTDDHRARLDRQGEGRQFTVSFIESIFDEGDLSNH